MKLCPKNGSSAEAYTDIAHAIGSIVESRQILITAASQKENERRDFTAATDAAEHLFHKKQWEEAQKAFATALQLYRPGFSPERAVLEGRKADCAAEIQSAAKATALEAQKKEYESLLAAADNATDSKQVSQITEQAMRLRQSGFSEDMEELHQRLKATRTKWPPPPVPEKIAAPRPHNPSPALGGGGRPFSAISGGNNRSGKKAEHAGKTESRAEEGAKTREVERATGATPPGPGRVTKKNGAA